MEMRIAQVIITIDTRMKYTYSGTRKIDKYIKDKTKIGTTQEINKATTS